MKLLNETLYALVFTILFLIMFPIAVVGCVARGVVIAFMIGWRVGAEAASVGRRRL